MKAKWKIPQFKKATEKNSFVYINIRINQSNGMDRYNLLTDSVEAEGQLEFYFI